MLNLPGEQGNFQFSCFFLLRSLVSASKTTLNYGSHKSISPRPT